MFKVRIIPCLDVKDGRVVKGVNFVNLRDAGDPVEAAIAYDAAGADELCFLDITASHENRDTIYDVVTRTAEACFMDASANGRDSISSLPASIFEKSRISSISVSNVSPEVFAAFVYVSCSGVSGVSRSKSAMARRCWPSARTWADAWPMSP